MLRSSPSKPMVGPVAPTAPHPIITDPTLRLMAAAAAAAGRPRFGASSAGDHLPRGTSVTSELYASYLYSRQQFDRALMIQQQQQAAAAAAHHQFSPPPPPAPHAVPPAPAPPPSHHSNPVSHQRQPPQHQHQQQQQPSFVTPPHAHSGYGTLGGGAAACLTPYHHHIGQGGAAGGPSTPVPGAFESYSQSLATLSQLSQRLHLQQQQNQHVHHQAQQQQPMVTSSLAAHRHHTPHAGPHTSTHHSPPSSDSVAKMRPSSPGSLRGTPRLVSGVKDALLVQPRPARLTPIDRQNPYDFSEADSSPEEKYFRFRGDVDEAKDNGSRAQSQHRRHHHHQGVVGHDGSDVYLRQSIGPSAHDSHPAAVVDPIAHSHQHRHRHRRQVPAEGGTGATTERISPRVDRSGGGGQNSSKHHPETAVTSTGNSLATADEGRRASVGDNRARLVVASGDRSASSHFISGSVIQLADGRLKRVDDLNTQDFVLSATDTGSRRGIERYLAIESSRVVHVRQNHDTATAVLGFIVGTHQTPVTIEASIEHPFFVYGIGWSSCCPDRTKQRYGLTCRQLSVGDTCISLTRSQSRSIRQMTDPDRRVDVVNARPSSDGHCGQTSERGTSKSMTCWRTFSTNDDDSDDHQKDDDKSDKGSRDRPAAIAGRKRRWSAPDCSSISTDDDQLDTKLTGLMTAKSAGVHVDTANSVCLEGRRAKEQCTSLMVDNYNNNNINNNNNNKANALVTNKAK